MGVQKGRHLICRYGDPLQAGGYLELKNDARSNLAVEANMMISRFSKESIKSTEVQDKGSYKLLSFIGDYEEKSAAISLIYTDEDRTRWLA